MTTEVGLTGNQVRAFRDHLGEGQMVFSRRIAVSQPAIWRLEKKGNEMIRSPETILISRIAAELGYSFDEASE